MEGDPNETEYDRLAREFRASMGPLEYLVDFIQDGIELEHFRDTSAGKVLIGSCVRSARAAMEIILDPNSGDAQVQRSVAELRVQHRVLNTIAESIRAGREATRRLNLADQDIQEDIEL